jgi:hypothetical protein
LQIRMILARYPAIDSRKYPPRQQRKDEPAISHPATLMKKWIIHC